MVMERADRVITLKDGLVAEDKWKSRN